MRWKTNREILFKGKRKDNGEWVEGALLQADDASYIATSFLCENPDTPLTVAAYEVDPDTICQYTGLMDKNGEKIWEGDILRGYEYPYMCDGKENYYAEVTYFENCPAFCIYTFKNPKSNVRGISEGNTDFMTDWNSEAWEVIGNIFDNPELLEVE